MSVFVSFFLSCSRLFAVLCLNCGLVYFVLAMIGSITYDRLEGGHVELLLGLVDDEVEIKCLAMFLFVVVGKVWIALDSAQCTHGPLSKINPNYSQFSINEGSNMRRLFAKA